MNRPSKLLTGCLILLLVSYFPTDASVPRLADRELEPTELSKFIDNRQLVLLHDEQTIPTPDGTTEGRYVTSLMVVDTDVENARDAVTDYESYPDFLPTLNDVTISKTDGDSQWLDFQLELRLGVVNPDLYYTLRYENQETGDITWERTKGDISASYGRWEFFELPENRTLLAYTSWTDFTDVGWSVDTVLWAQPDLKLAIPVSQSAVFMKHLRDKISEETRSDTSDSLPASPDVPLLARADSAPEQITQLTELGIPMIIHPNQTIRQQSGEPLDLTFVTAIGSVSASQKRAKELLTRFEKFPDFVEQVSYVNADDTDTGYEATWSLSMGLGILSVGIDYRLAYDWTSDRSLVFRRIGGDLDHVYGALEWQPISTDRTLFYYTTATQIGENAGYLVKLGNMIPNKQIVIGVSAGALAVEKQIKWANQQLDDQAVAATDQD